MYIRVILSLFLVLNASIIFANNWTGSSYTSALKKSASLNEKDNPLKAFEQYSELCKFYHLINPDSVKYFSNRSLSSALLSNESDLVVISWLLQIDPNSNLKTFEIAKAKQGLNRNSTKAIRNLIKLYEGTENVLLLLKESDSLIHSYEANNNNHTEKEKLIHALLVNKRAALGYEKQENFVLDANLDLVAEIFKSKGLLGRYITSLIYKTRVLNSALKFNESIKICYLLKEQAKQLDNYVYYQSASMNLAAVAKQAKLYSIVEKECNDLIEAAFSQEHKSKLYATDRLSEAYNVLYNIYSEQSKYDKALFNIRKCIYYSDSLAKLHSVNDSIMAIDARFNLAAYYGYTGMFKESVVVLDEILKRVTLEKDPIMFAMASVNLAINYVNLGKYQKSLYHLNNGQPIIESYLGWQAKAELYLTKRDAFKLLGKLDSAMAYTSLYEIAKDSIFNIDKQKALLEVVEKYDNDKLAADNRTLTAETEASNTKEWLYWSVIGFTIVLGFVGFKVVKNERKLTVKQQELLNTEKENLANKLAAKEAEEAKYKIELELNEVKEQEIRSQLEFKSRETISMATVALQNANLLVEIQGIVKGINGNQEENNRIMREVNSLINNQKHLEAFWDTFRRYFQEVHPRFFEILEERHPKLTLNDQKVCAYLVLGMSTNEISLLQNIEPRSFLRTRQRLKEKMGLESSEEIEVYLNSIG